MQVNKDITNVISKFQSILSFGFRVIAVQSYTNYTGDISIYIETVAFCICLRIYLSNKIQVRLGILCTYRIYNKECFHARMKEIPRFIAFADLICYEGRYVCAARERALSISLTHSCLSLSYLGNYLNKHKKNYRCNNFLI